MKIKLTEAQYKTWGEMTDDEKTEIVVGQHVHGVDVEFYYDLSCNWVTKLHGVFCEGSKYRLANQPSQPNGATIEFSHDELVSIGDAGESLHELWNTINQYLNGKQE